MRAARPHAAVAEVLSRLAALIRPCRGTFSPEGRRKKASRFPSLAVMLGLDPSISGRGRRGIPSPVWERGRGEGRTVIVLAVSWPPLRMTLCLDDRGQALTPAPLTDLGPARDQYSECRSRQQPTSMRERGSPRAATATSRERHRGLRHGLIPALRRHAYPPGTSSPRGRHPEVCQWREEVRRLRVESRSTPGRLREPPWGYYGPCARSSLGGSKGKVLQPETRRGRHRTGKCDPLFGTIRCTRQSGAQRAPCRTGVEASGTGTGEP